MQVISLSVILLRFALVKSTLHKDNNVVIFRGDKDRFTSKIACSKSKAVCFDESCVYCQCMEDQTFVRSRGYHGECVLNKLLVYATSDEAYFLVENNPNQKCLYYENDFVRGSKCSHNNRQYYWIWTKNGQLLNWESLKCMTDNYHATHYFVRMKKCYRNDPKQLWKCESHVNNHYMKQTKSGRYLYYGEYEKYVTTKGTQWSTARVWARYGSTQNVCSQAVGCETFADGSSIIILNNTKCEENSECLGEKEIDLNKTRCTLLPHQSQYLHIDTWKPLKMKNGSFEIEVKMQVSLKWNLTITPKSWAGLMVKVQFKCEETTGSNVTETEHCVVIKYTGSFKGFNYNKRDEKPTRQIFNDLIHSNDDDIKETDPTSRQEINNNNNDNDKNNKKSSSKDDNKIVIIIICVCALVPFCIAGVIGIVYCKRRHRFAYSKNSGTENTDQNQAPVLLPLNERELSTSNEPTQRDSRAYEIPNERPYELTDNTAFTSPQLFDHDNTSDDGSAGYVIQPDTEDNHVSPQSPQYEVPNSCQYEYPDQSQSHQYEYLSLKSTEADTRGKTDVSVQDSTYSPLVRPPLNENERENGDYTSLIKGKKTTDKVGSTAKKDEADRLSHVHATSGDYTPLVRPPFKDKESEDGCYTSLIKNEKTSEKADPTAKKNEACELPYVDAINGDYTPLAKLKPNESEIPVYQPLLKNGQKELK